MATDLSANVQAVADQATQASLQSSSQAANLAMQNAVTFQNMANNAALGMLTAGMQVAQSYQGSHLRRGAETDVQEMVAEGHGYKAESVASLPQQSIQAIVAAVTEQVLAKVAQTTPPQTAGHAPEAPKPL